MISLYSGTPGAGKSLHIAQVLYYRLRAKKAVVSNFDLNLDLVRGKRKTIGDYVYCPNDQLLPQYLIAYSQAYFSHRKFKEGAILLVLDEAQLLFNARTWDAKGRSDWLSFFTQHRKYGYDVILVAQFDRMIDRQIRSLIEYEYKHRKVGNAGKFGALFTLSGQESHGH